MGQAAAKLTYVQASLFCADRPHAGAELASASAAAAAELLASVTPKGAAGAPARPASARGASMRSMASADVADLEGFRQEVDARLRRALISAGRVRPTAGGSSRASSKSVITTDAPPDPCMGTDDARHCASQHRPHSMSQPGYATETVLATADAACAEGIPCRSGLPTHWSTEEDSPAAPEIFPNEPAHDYQDTSSDPLPCDSVEWRAEHRWRANLWISDTAPKGWEEHQEKGLWQEMQDRKAKEQREHRLLVKRLAGNKRDGFQEFVKKHRRHDAYAVSTCLPLWKPGEKRESVEDEDLKRQQELAAQRAGDHHDHVKAHIASRWKKVKARSSAFMHFAHQ